MWLYLNAYCTLSCSRLTNAAWLFSHFILKVDGIFARAVTAYRQYRTESILPAAAAAAAAVRECNIKMSTMSLFTAADSSSDAVPESRSSTYSDVTPHPVTWREHNTRTGICTHIEAQITERSNDLAIIDTIVYLHLKRPMNSNVRL